MFVIWHFVPPCQIKDLAVYIIRLVFFLGRDNSLVRLPLRPLVSPPCRYKKQDGANDHYHPPPPIACQITPPPNGRGNANELRANGDTENVPKVISTHTRYDRENVIAYQTADHSDRIE